MSKDLYKLIAEEIKESGIMIQKGVLSETDIKALLQEIKIFQGSYSEYMVEGKLFRKRENHLGRLGDALMVSVKAPECAPYLLIGEEGGSEKTAFWYENYIGVLSEFVEEEVPESTRVLLNYQFYKGGTDNSLPFHFDAEIFDGIWDKNYIELEEGLIPRLVMVIVLENENDGKGLEIMNFDGEIFEVELFPGDILYFDNTSVLHGVPEGVKNKRTMLGFRSFETQPLHFKKDGFEDGHLGAFDIDTPYVKGEAIQLTTHEAKVILEEQGWIKK